MHNEKLSALMDGEPFDSELFNDLSRDVKLQQSWQRYHLIRDVICGDAGEVLHLDIADRVAAAIAEEPVRIAPQTVKESQPAPETWQKSPFWRRARPFTARIAQFGIASHLTQIGVAACVSLAVIVGVQHYNTQQGVGQDSSQPENPVFNTLPMMGQASPVSLGVPSANSARVDNGNQQMQVQEQRRRINAILQDYELHLRLHADTLQFDQQDAQQATVQVPGTQSLGIQPQ
ncbi:Sigma factor RpoE negative regulatory protein RseA [Candidatus Sodalis pierantonius str. SOPE]|uniref:Anti-sigma-E factor RseA n=1 Tax=Candidatus Sodalis pierantonii str. SOPE TaxID=2342 RepID=W0HR67_9GAMM|nr:anti-sigma-E factor RseA [Candidatus Sodalis pierantonius]AHF74623.1 Sigma factor RpoE negative regulatory protein RseA [Candidatus Sodalis pierantonius str. SOPE]